MTSTHEEVEVDWARAKEADWKHHKDSTEVDTRGEKETWKTEGNLQTYDRKGVEEEEHYLGRSREIGQEPRRVA